MTKPEFIPTVKEVESILLPKIKPSGGPLFFATSLKEARGHVLDSGSFGLVDTGKKKLLVTCHHVWNDFLKQRAKHSKCKLCVCLDERSPVVFSEFADGTKIEPIDQNKELDIATFDMSPFLSACKGRRFFKLDTGVGGQLKEQDAVAIIGYPGKFRTELEEGISFGNVPHIGFASSISGYFFVMDFTRMMSINRELDMHHKSEKHQYGGISGGPCFMFGRDYEPVLVGIVSDNLKFSFGELDIIKITSTSCIDEDGKLRPAASAYE